MSSGALAPEARSASAILAEGFSIIPAVGDALSAKLVESAGFTGVYLSLAAVTQNLGLAHPALVTMTEFVEEAELVANAVSIPVICDAGDGFGNYLNAQRTVRALAQRGAAAVVLSDGDPNPVTDPEEMAGKIAAAVNARASSEPLIVAALSGPAVEDELRCEAYVRAGADALLTREPVANRSVPLIGIVQEPETSVVEASRLADLGFSAVVDTRLQTVGTAGLHGLLAHLQEAGTVTDWLDRMATTAFITELLGLPELRRLEGVYGRDSGSTWTPW